LLKSDYALHVTIKSNTSGFIPTLYPDLDQTLFKTKNMKVGLLQIVEKFFLRSA